jgi:hypothetical protein
MSNLLYASDEANDPRLNRLVPLTFESIFSHLGRSFISYYWIETHSGALLVGAGLIWEKRTERMCWEHCMLLLMRQTLPMFMYWLDKVMHYHLETQQLPLHANMSVIVFMSNKSEPFYTVLKSSLVLGNRLYVFMSDVCVYNLVLWLTLVLTTYI